jgi:CDP-paratose 2-epimerase
MLIQKDIDSEKNTASSDKCILITGGAGFIGANLADMLLQKGEKVIVYDNLSRCGSEKNLRWLKDQYKENLIVCIEDIRNVEALKMALTNVKMVFHFAAQVAVTSSISDPLGDFDVNVKGTLNVIEQIRQLSGPPPLIMTSTNKVYGNLACFPLQKKEKRYAIKEMKNKSGVNESMPLDFHSPYGCSKGAADQYILDYSRTYGLKTAVFRMSCIYGPHQYGNEDQGWIAHIMSKSIKGDTLVIYGDGCQVRDALHIKDLLNAFITGWKKMEIINGNAFNIGGGPKNTISILELISHIEQLIGKKVDFKHAPWRSGDQKYYVSNFSKFNKLTGWKPDIGIHAGLHDIYTWLVHQGLHESDGAAKSEDLAKCSK